MALKYALRFLILLLIHQNYASATNEPKYPQNCFQTKENGQQMLRIDEESRPFKALCEQETSGGGWTVILNRFDGSVDFSQRTCQDYKFGFGNLSGEFFLGLDQLNALTSVENHMLFVVMTDFNGTEYISTYDTFIVWDETFEYSTGISSKTGLSKDVGFTKWNAFCSACSKLRCMHDVPGWQLNPYLEKTIHVDSVAQFFGSYPESSIDTGRSKMGLYYQYLQKLVPLRSIKMMIRPFKTPDNFKGHSKKYANLDRRFLPLDLDK